MIDYFKHDATRAIRSPVALFSFTAISLPRTPRARNALAESFMREEVTLAEVFPVIATAEEYSSKDDAKVS